MLSKPTHAFVKPPPRSFASALTMDAAPQRVDLDLALRQHAAYVQTLRQIGVIVTELEPDDRFPDSCFIQDVAFQCGDRLIIARPGAATRREEPDAIMPALQTTGLPLHRIEAPATLDGGDVLLAENMLFIGISSRTNIEAVENLRRLGAASSIVPVALDAGLHLLSGCSYLGENRLLVAPALIDRGELSGFERLALPIEETAAANVLTIGGDVIMPRGYPNAERMLDRAGLRVHPLDMSEFQKRDGGVTCLSLLYSQSAQRRV